VRRELFEQSGRVRSQVRQIAAAAAVLLLRTQEFHQDSGLAPRKLIERVAPRWQVHEQDLVLNPAHGR